MEIRFGPLTPVAHRHIPITRRPKPGPVSRALPPTSSSAYVGARPAPGGCACFHFDSTSEHALTLSRDAVRARIQRRTPGHVGASSKAIPFARRSAWRNCFPAASGLATASRALRVPTATPGSRKEGAEQEGRLRTPPEHPLYKYARARWLARRTLSRIHHAGACQPGHVHVVWCAVRLSRGDPRGSLTASCTVRL